MQQTIGEHQSLAQNESEKVFFFIMVILFILVSKKYLDLKWYFM